MEDAQFIAYLEGTLIPDLRESGNDATADDFEFCLKIIQDLQEQVEQLSPKPLRRCAKCQKYLPYDTPDSVHVHPAGSGCNDTSNS